MVPLHFPKEGKNVLQLGDAKEGSKAQDSQHSHGETRYFSGAVLILDIFTASKQRAAACSLRVNSGHSLVFTQRVKEEWFLHL